VVSCVTVGDSDGEDSQHAKSMVHNSSRSSKQEDKDLKPIVKPSYSYGSQKKRLLAKAQSEALLAAPTSFKQEPGLNNGSTGHHHYEGNKQSSSSSFKSVTKPHSHHSTAAGSTPSTNGRKYNRYCPHPTPMYVFCSSFSSNCLLSFHF